MSALSQSFQVAPVKFEGVAGKLGEAKQCQEFLRQFCVADCIADKVTAEGFKNFDIVGVPENYTVGETLTLFANNGIISAPIYKGRASKMDQDEQSNVLGIVNMMDLVIAVTKPLHKRFGQSGLLPNDPQLSNDQLRNELESCSVLKHPIGETLGLSKESSAWNPLKLTDNLDTLLSKFSQGTHRVLVMPNNEQEVQQLQSSHQWSREALQAIRRPHFISQFDFIRFLNNNSKGLGDFLYKTVNDFGKFDKAASDKSPSPGFLRVSPSDQELSGHVEQQKELLTCSAQHTALSAFHLLYKNWANVRVSALPIVEAGTNKLIASLSASDLRGMTPKRLPTLLLPVVDYLAQLPPESHPFQPIFTCVPSDKMGAVLQKLVNYHIHRVWVVEPSKQQEVSQAGTSEEAQRGRRKSGSGERPSVIGVVSGTDILASMEKCGAFA